MSNLVLGGFTGDEFLLIDKTISAWPTWLR